MKIPKPDLSNGCLVIESPKTVFLLCYLLKTPQIGKRHIYLIDRLIGMKPAPFGKIGKILPLNYFIKCDLAIVIRDKWADSHKLLHIQIIQLLFEIVLGRSWESIDIAAHRHRIDVEIKVVFLSKLGHQQIGYYDFLNLIAYIPLIIAKHFLCILHDNGTGASGMSHERVLHGAKKIYPTHACMNQEWIHIPGIIFMRKKIVIFTGKERPPGSVGNLSGNLSFAVGLYYGSAFINNTCRMGVRGQIFGKSVDISWCVVKRPCYQQLNGMLGRPGNVIDNKEDQTDYTAPKQKFGSPEKGEKDWSPKRAVPGKQHLFGGIFLKRLHVCIISVFKIPALPKLFADCFLFHSLFYIFFRKYVPEGLKLDSLLPRLGRFVHRFSPDVLRLRNAAFFLIIVLFHNACFSHINRKTCKPITDRQKPLNRKPLIMQALYRDSITTSNENFL